MIPKRLARRRARAPHGKDLFPLQDGMVAEQAVELNLGECTSSRANGEKRNN